MNKIGIVGHFGEGRNLLNGQTVKTKIITDELVKRLDRKDVIKFDTHDWNKKPFSIIIQGFKIFKNCENVIILPARRGVKVIVPIFAVLSKLYGRKLHYVVIGGWLPEMIKSNWVLKKFTETLDGVYVETHNMAKMLKTLGIDNVHYFPNFKTLKPISKSDLVFPKQEPYQLCTFSRVMKEKGIESAIEAVKKVNNEMDRVVYTLDIYGQIEKGYEETFRNIQSELPSYISYKGRIPYDKSTLVLKNYFALLLPTFYDGEGFPGTVIDAFTAGVPVIATDWKYNSEVVHNGKNGIIYSDLENGLTKTLKEITKNPSQVIMMKKNCIEEAKKFSSDLVMKEFISELELY